MWVEHKWYGILMRSVGDLGNVTGYFQLFSPTHGIFSNETTLSALLMEPLPSCTCVSLVWRGQRHLWCQAQISQGASIYCNGPVTEATLTDSSLSAGCYSARDGNPVGLRKRKAHHRTDIALWDWKTWLKWHHFWLVFQDAKFESRE